MPGVTRQDVERLQLTTIDIGGNSINATDAAQIDGITAGTAAASKALVLDSSKRVTSAVVDAPVQTAAVGSTGTTLSSHGVINITSSAAKTFTLEAPRAGAVVQILLTGGTTLVRTVSLASGTVGTGSATKLLLNGAGDAVTIAGISTAKFIITSNVGSVATST